MKHLLIILMLLIFCFPGHAQTWGEIFNQKKTQKKYLIEQISALQVYAGYLQKGYTIARDGIQTVQSIRKGDFNLHSNFFASLGLMNPRIRQYAKVADILLMQVNIAKQAAATIRQCRESNQLTHTEINYLQSVFNRLLEDCAQSLDELADVIGNNRLQMKDDERIKRIDAIYTEMQDKQVFVQSFSHSANGLTIQRNTEAVEIIISRKLNGVQ
ncbi:MAG: hypothetical protein ABI581_07150 [Sediminibacterium sp.]